MTKGWWLVAGGALMLALSSCEPAEKCACVEAAAASEAYRDHRGWRWVVPCKRVECSRVIER